EVGRIDRRRLDLHQHLVGAGIGKVDVDERHGELAGFGEVRAQLQPFGHGSFSRCSMNARLVSMPGHEKGRGTGEGPAWPTGRRRSCRRTRRPTAISMSTSRTNSGSLISKTFCCVPPSVHMTGLLRGMNRGEGAR